MGLLPPSGSIRGCEVPRVFQASPVQIMAVGPLPTALPEAGRVEAGRTSEWIITAQASQAGQEARPKGVHGVRSTGLAARQRCTGALGPGSSCLAGTGQGQSRGQGWGNRLVSAWACLPERHICVLYTFPSVLYFEQREITWERRSVSEIWQARLFELLLTSCRY